MNLNELREAVEAIEEHKGTIEKSFTIIETNKLSLYWQEVYDSLQTLISLAEDVIKGEYIHKNSRLAIYDNGNVGIR